MLLAGKYCGTLWWIQNVAHVGYFLGTYPILAAAIDEGDEVLHKPLLPLFSKDTTTGSNTHTLLSTPRDTSSNWGSPTRDSNQKQVQSANSVHKILDVHPNNTTRRYRNSSLGFRPPLQHRALSRREFRIRFECIGRAVCSHVSYILHPLPLNRIMRLTMPRIQLHLLLVLPAPQPPMPALHLLSRHAQQSRR